jgi:hypothetical protein
VRKSTFAPSTGHYSCVRPPAISDVAGHANQWTWRARAGRNRLLMGEARNRACLPSCGREFAGPCRQYYRVAVPRWFVTAARSSPPAPQPKAGPCSLPCRDTDSPLDISASATGCSAGRFRSQPMARIARLFGLRFMKPCFGVGNPQAGSDIGKADHRPVPRPMVSRG